jgi:hypothetical protein
MPATLVAMHLSLTPHRSDYDTTVPIVGVLPHYILGTCGKWAPEALALCCMQPLCREALVHCGWVCAMCSVATTIRHALIFEPPPRLTVSEHVVWPRTLMREHWRALHVQAADRLSVTTRPSRPHPPTHVHHVTCRRTGIGTLFAPPAASLSMAMA